MYDANLSAIFSHFPLSFLLKKRILELNIIYDYIAIAQYNLFQYVIRIARTFKKRRLKTRHRDI